MGHPVDLQNLVQGPGPHLNVVDVNVVLRVFILGVVRSVSVGGLVVFGGLLLLTVLFLLLQRENGGNTVMLSLDYSAGSNQIWRRFEKKPI